MKKEEEEMIFTMLFVAHSMLNTPYLWGGNSPLIGVDCSGFIQTVLSSVGIDPPGDQTSQALYNHLSKKGWPSQLAKGSVLFFGKNRQEITHVSMAYNEKLMIESSGGDSKTKTLQDAIDKDARVKINPINRRSDLVAVLKPQFNKDVIHERRN